MGLRTPLTAALVWVAALGGTRAFVAVPEHCPPVTASDVRAAAEAAVGWFAANQLDDGRFVYRVDADTRAVDRRPHLVRHAGVTMSLYQADAAGIAGARDVADRATEWALEHVVDAGGGRALTFGDRVPTGATGLLVAGLATRRAHTGDDGYDADLDALGRFLVSMIEPSGAVLSDWDPASRAPFPNRYSIYYTGEALWGLAMLATVDPAGEWGDAAARIARYVATERADAEPRFPPLADHWAAYGLAQLELGAAHPLDGSEDRYATRLAALFGVQIRYESQRTGEGLNESLFRGGQVLGAGLGTIGEGLGQLDRLAAGGGGGALAGERDVIAARVGCVASMLVRRQVTADSATGRALGPLAVGAWFHAGVTQKDDQQHALSALLSSVPVIERGVAEGASDEDPSAWRVLWLAVIAFVATNPPRARRVVAGVERRPRLTGAAVTTAVAAIAALLAGPLLRSLDVSPATGLVAAGLVVTLSALVDLVRPRPPAAPTGRRPWLVPVTVPALLRPAPLFVVVGVAASAGVANGLDTVVGVAVGMLLATWRPAGSDRLGLHDWLVRSIGAVAVLGGIDLIVHGVLAI